MAERIALVTQDHVYLVLPHEILYCKSNNMLTTFFLKDNSQLVVSKSIKAVEKMLEPHGFIRPHQSYLVNKEHIIRIDKNEGYTLVLSNKQKIPSATRRRKEMLEELKTSV